MGLPISALKPVLVVGNELLHYLLYKILLSLIEDRSISL
jgi:hypothetical protein